MNDYQKHLAAYLSIMAQVKCMLRQQIISADEYAKIDTMFLKKYGLSSFSLFRQDPLINLADRVNIDGATRIFCSKEAAMERKITEIAARPSMPTRIKTAAYARVSSGKDAMLHSLSAQVSHYSELIQSNPNWEYVGVYAEM